MVSQIEALHRLGLIDSRRLPDLAVGLLSQDRDTEAIRRLAALGLEPFDPRDANDLLGEIIAEDGSNPISDAEAVEEAAGYLAWLMTERQISAKAGTHRFYLLGVASGYRSHPPELMELFGLDDMWDLGLQPVEVTEATALDLAGRIVARHRESLTSTRGSLPSSSTGDA